MRYCGQMLDRKDATSNLGGLGLSDQILCSFLLFFFISAKYLLIFKKKCVVKMCSINLDWILGG